jgi:hypothetical protein
MTPCGTREEPWVVFMLRKDKDDLIVNRDHEVEWRFKGDIKRYKGYLSNPFSRNQTDLIELQYKVQNKTIWLEQAIIFLSKNPDNCNMHSIDFREEVKKLVDIRYNILEDPDGDNKINPLPFEKTPEGIRRNAEIKKNYKEMLPRVQKGHRAGDEFSASAVFSENSGGRSDGYYPGK